MLHSGSERQMEVPYHKQVQLLVWQATVTGLICNTRVPNIHERSWWHPRQAQELILGPCLGAKARFLSFNRTQSRAVTGPLTGHNTLRRYLHLRWLSDSPLYRRRGAEEETSAHILCRCEAWVSLRHVYLGSFFLEPEDIKGRFTHSTPFPCRAHAIPLPCRVLIHTYYGVPLPCSDNAVSFKKLRMVAGNIQTASRTV